MIRMKNSYGNIEISDMYLANLVSHEVKKCFGVVGLASSGASQGFRQWLSKTGEIPDEGVIIHHVKDQLDIDLHIIVTYGMNIEAIVRSIINKTSFIVEQATSQIVRKVNVFVDGMQA